MRTPSFSPDFFIHALFAFMMLICLYLLIGRIVSNRKYKEKKTLEKVISSIIEKSSSLEERIEVLEKNHKSLSGNSQELITESLKIQKVVFERKEALLAENQALKLERGKGHWLLEKIEETLEADAREKLDEEWDQLNEEHLKLWSNDAFVVPSGDD